MSVTIISVIKVKYLTPDKYHTTKSIRRYYESESKEISIKL